MLADILSGVLRALSFVFLLQAAGAALFVAAFGCKLAVVSGDIRRLGQIAAGVGVAWVLAHYSLEAARMVGELSGVADPSLQRMVLSSASGAMLTLRVLGLLLIAFGLQGEGEFRSTSGVIGATLAVASFTMVGHTPVHSHRWVLAPMLIAHLVIIAFWFGALLPLYLISARERPEVAVTVIDGFSKIAIWLVPGILLAGLVLAAVLIPHLEVLKEPYGLPRI